MINVAIERNANENGLNTLRRFTKRVQGSGILSRVRADRYSKRNETYLSRKTMALRRLARKKEIERLSKLGKLKVVAKR
jgi:ribosomal protein S21